MKEKVQCREELIQELHEQRERVRQLFERLNRDCENVQSREEIIQELHEEREGVRQLFDQLNRDYEQVEQKLKSSEERMMAIVQASPLALISLDLDGAVTLWNPAAERMFGWKEYEVMGKPLPYVTEAMQQEHLALRKRVLSGEAFSGVEVRRCRKDGSPIDLSVSTAPLRDSRGSVDGIVSLNEDITERKRVEEALERRILALTRPLEDIESIAFDDLFNLSDLQRLQDLFAESWGVSALITRPDGTPITRPSNFSHFCGEIIRKTPKGLQKCQISDAMVGRHNPSGPNIQQCLSAGLWNAETSITLGGRHIANWLIGQVRNEAQTEEQMLEFARAIGADEKTFLEAFRKVPAVSQEQFERIANAHFALASQLSTIAYQNVQQARFIEERRKAEKALRESEELFSVFMSHLPACAFIKEADGRTVFANRYFQELFGVRDYAGRTTPELIPSILAMQMVEDDRRALGGSVVRVMETVRDKRGSERTFQTLKFPIRISGKPVRMGGVAVDITDLKQSEAALRESKERMSQALRAANAGAWEWNCRTNEAVWSDENYLVLGLKPGSVKSCYENWLSMVHPEDRDTADRLVSEAVRRQRDLDISFRVVWPDGSVHWIIDRGKLVYEESGEPFGMYGIQIDITDRKLADLALEESERNYREIFNGTQDAIFIHDPETGAILDVNQGMLDMYGYSREEAAQLTINDVSLGVVPYDQCSALEALRKTPAEGPQVFEWLARRKNGELFWAEVVLKGTTIGGASRVLAVVRDIDERKRAQEQIRRKEEYYRSLFENAMDIVTILGADGTILYESPSVEGIVGFRPEELVSLNGFSLIHPEDVEPIREIFERLARNPGSIERGEFRFRHKDGSWRILEAIGNNLLQDPAVGAIVLNERDVTDRRDAEQRLRISLKEKEILLREVHHRVKNNLQVISSLLDLQSANLDDPRLREAFRDSKQRVKTMAMIHEKLYGTGDFSSIMLSGYVEDLVQAIVEANRPGGAVAVRCDVPAIPLSVNAAVPCSLIINELVSNCLKHAFGGGRNGYIRVSVQSTEDGRLTLAVEDDGPGLPEHFDIDRTRSLGLTIVKALVKQLNGTMEIDRGAGARFRITFSDKA